MNRLEDFENSCAAYDKSIELNSDDYLTYLNYTITLYLNDEMELAKLQFEKFEGLFNAAVELAIANQSEIDPDIYKQADLLRSEFVTNKFQNLTA